MTSLRFSTVRLTLLFATALLLPATALVPDADARGQRRLARWDSNPGQRELQDCRRARVCVDHQRLLLDVRDQSDETVGQYVRRGCTVLHALRGMVSLSCPNTVTVHDARLERVFRAVGLHTATQITAHEVWSSSGGYTGDGVRVAVLDTGMETSHPDLGGAVVQSVNFTSGPGDDVLGHGTHVAGIVAGEGQVEIEGDTAHGVAPGVSLLSAKVCNDDGWCLEGDILAGMEWAVSQGADVVNMSLGGGAYGEHCDGDLLANRVNWMVSEGVTVVAAAGNSNAGVASPACASKAVAVGAVDDNNDRTPWSNYGSALDVMAPGVSVFSTFSCIAAGSCPDPAYGWMSGTSMASPHVAGVAALLLQAYPEMTPAEILTVLRESAVDLGPRFPDYHYGWGLVDAAAAVRQAGELYPDYHCQDADGDGFLSCENDCDDTDPFVNPDAAEVCNGADDNCDGRNDEACRFEFCGDRICSGPENAESCPQDCRGRQKSDTGKGNSGKKAEAPGQIRKYQVCGDRICEGLEWRSCPRDCGTVLSPVTGNGSGKGDQDKVKGKSKSKGKSGGKGRGRGKGGK